MPAYVSTTPGLYPLPDWSKDDLADLKGHQRDDLVTGDEPEPVEAVYDDVREEVIATQEAAGLDRIVEGQARWDDMIAHPLCVHDNVDTGGLVRYYDNNNFYRDPVVTGELSPDDDIAEDLERASRLTDDLQGVVPGPYSLFDLATDEHYGSDAAFVDALGAFLAGEIERFPPIDPLVVLEPSLATRPLESELQGAVADALAGVVNAADTDVIVHTYWGAPTEAAHQALLDAGPAAIGYDVVTDPDGVRDLLRAQGSTDAVALGVVDGQNTAVESPAAIRDRIERIVGDPDGIDPETVYVTSNTELYYLPVTKFEAKLEALGAATEEVVA